MTGQVDGHRLLTRLAQLARVGAGPEGQEGVTRLAWSPEERAAVALVGGWAGEAGANVWVDPAGNLIAELAGSDPALPPLVTGSHLDTVVGAGTLDGAYGVVAGAEVLSCLRDAGIGLRHPLRVVAYVNEEGVVAPPFTGSRAIVGGSRPEELTVRGTDGVALAERMRRAGCDPARIADGAWSGPVAATVELHVEQGPVLDRSATPIGVVTAISAQQRGTITVGGETNHAGTTPMSMRRDALVAAARVVLAVEDLAISGPADVATVGRLRVDPGVANVIAGGCELSFDLRSVDGGGTDEAMARLRESLAAIEKKTGCSLTVHALPPTLAVSTDETLRQIITRAAGSLGLDSRLLPSGAGHDCAQLARLGPVAMIFVPSTSGISHNPAESTPDGALVDGASVLLETIVSADRTLDPQGV